MDAFGVLMQSSKRKADELENDRVIGIGYEGKLCGEGVRVDDPLYGTCYYGIAVRPGYSSPEALLEKRRREHKNASVTEPKDLGIRAILARYGSQAIVWRILESKVDATRVDTQKWANEWEKNAIAVAGGVLRDIDPDQPIRQTFNLTSGGNGDAASWWQGIETRNTAKWNMFLRLLEAHVREVGTARVHRDYVAPDGYFLGRSVQQVRQGQLLHGRVDEADRRATLEALPGWTWNVYDTAWVKFQNAIEEHVKEFGEANATQCFQTRNGYNLGYKINNIRQGMMLDGKKDEAERRAYLEALPGWVWHTHNAKWNEFQSALHAYVLENKTARVPFKYVNDSGYKLGHAVMNVRKQRTHLKDAANEAARLAWLDSLPGWRW